MKIIPLGTKGYIPTFGRHTMSFLIFDNESLFLIDAGTGLSRLNEPQIMNIINRYEKVNIILSHYHLDHITGLPYLAGIIPNTKFSIYLPSKPFVDIEGISAIKTFLNPPFFSLDIQSFPNFSSSHNVTSPIFKIDKHKFEFIRLNHEGGSMGIKINNTISYITDTTADTNIIDFIKDSKILLHEVWMTQQEVALKPNDATRHSIYENVIDIMKKSNISKLVPIHLNPAWTEDNIYNIFRDKIVDGIEVIFPIEGKIIEI